MFNVLKSASSSLPDAQRKMYTKEKTENFRLVAQYIASKSPYTLTSADLASTELQAEISDIGEFAEVAHGRLSPHLIWDYMDHLSKPGFPVEEYKALQDSAFVTTFYGKVASLQGYIAYRPRIKQLVIAFSGTSAIGQTLRNLDVRLAAYPDVDGAAVHSGFWKVYQGVQYVAMTQLRMALSNYDVKSLLITGHSMGAAMTYLFALDVMNNATKWEIPPSIPLTVVAFGSPRLGNDVLAAYWRKTVASRPSFTTYSIMGFNDGVPAIPPTRIGFRHFSPSPLYHIQGRLYKIPEDQSEYTVFGVDTSREGHKEWPPASKYPLGGHNYYNDRDMEKLIRCMSWFNTVKPGPVDWEEYSRWLKEHEG